MAGKKKSVGEENKTPAKAPATKVKKTGAKVPDPPAAQPKPEKKSNKRKSHVTRPTAAEKALIIERRILVYELKKAGHTFRQIAEHLKTKSEFKRGITVGSVHNDFQEELAERRKELTDCVDTYRQMALDELNDLRRAVLPRARREGLPEDVTSILNIQKREDAIMQYSKGQQSDAQLKDALIKFVGFDPEEELHHATNDKGD